LTWSVYFPADPKFDFGHFIGGHSGARIGWRSGRA
jgi:hypothetical protein